MLDRGSPPCSLLTSAAMWRAFGWVGFTTHLAPANFNTRTTRVVPSKLLDCWYSWNLRGLASWVSIVDALGELGYSESYLSVFLLKTGPDYWLFDRFLGGYRNQLASQIWNSKLFHGSEWFLEVGIPSIPGTSQNLTSFHGIGYTWLASTPSVSGTLMLEMEITRLQPRWQRQGHWFYQKVLVERKGWTFGGSSKDDHAIQLGKASGNASISRDFWWSSAKTSLFCSTIPDKRLKS